MIFPITDVTLLIMIMLQPPMSIAQGQRKAWYTDKERKVIDVHKEDYLKATSAIQRRQIAQHNLCPALFNYWRETGHNVVDPQAETKVCFRLWHRHFHPEVIGAVEIDRLGTKQLARCWFVRGTTS